MKKIVLAFCIAAISLIMSQCKTIDDIIDPKDYGDYTSVTVQFTVTFKGLNSIGHRTVTVHDGEYVAENFSYSKKPGSSEENTCENAVADKTHTFQVTLNVTSFKVTLAYNDWDYYGYVSNAVNYKLLCSEWSASVVGYTYTSGKDDPGTPLMSGLDKLALDIDSHCTGTRVHDCLTEADITISRNTTGSDIQSACAFTSTTNLKNSM